MEKIKSLKNIIYGLGMPFVAVLLGLYITFTSPESVTTTNTLLYGVFCCSIASLTGMDKIVELLKKDKEND